MFNVVKSYFGFGPPGEVHNNEIAPYNVLQKFEGYELIEWPEQKWVSTKATAPKNNSKNNSMFMKLFGYIDGKNARGDKISMTVPVMISNQKEENPPDPADPDLSIVTRPPMIMYSKFLSGFPNFEEEAKKFQGELEKNGHTDADFSVFYSAGWDAPFKLLNRRNEIMFRKLDSATNNSTTETSSETPKTEES